MTIAETLDKTLIADLYRQMQLIRAFEERCNVEYQRQNIKGFLHLYVGEEAVAVGAISTLREDDYIITSYRDHGHALARGMEPNVVMAELFGKVNGSSGGKGGSMHLFDVSRGFMGGHAIVAGQLPLAVGLALAAKIRKEDRVVMCFFGDGAVAEGEFHESLNFASLWKLPVVFLLENNLYGMGTQVERARAGGRDIFNAAEAYSIPALQINGQDVLEVREAASEAVQKVRSGEGPAFVEAMTYRFRGHSVADPQAYRERVEVDEWRSQNDPINNFRSTILAQDIIEETELEGIDKQVAEVVDEAVRFADESPEPSIDSLFDNVYAK
tara:strand:- start:776 stop:1756 length:981 start_codon:yes stop_codon:yes gene_type:complete